MVSFRLRRDRIIAIVSIVFFIVSGFVTLSFSSEFEVTIPFILGITVMAIVLTLMVVFYLMEPRIVHARLQKTRLPVPEIIRLIQSPIDERPNVEATILLPSNNAPLSFGFSVFLAMGGSLMLFIARVLSLGSLMTLMIIVAILLFLASLVNIIGLFVTPRPIEVIMFNDQIMIRIPDEASLILEKKTLTRLTVEYPLRSIWKQESLHPQITFVTSVKLATVELTPRLALALHDYGYGSLLIATTSTPPAPIR
jgi:hypothetical protein